MSISVAVKMRQAKNGELLLMLYRTVLTELEGIHKKVRLIIVERATCGGKLEGDKLAKQYSHSRTALYKQLSLVKDKFRKNKFAPHALRLSPPQDSGVLRRRKPKTARYADFKNTN